MSDRHLLRIELPDAPPPPSASAEADRRQAVQDLEGGNHFDPVGLGPGPFVLHLMVREGRLILDIRDKDDAPLRAIFPAALIPAAWKITRLRRTIFFNSSCADPSPCRERRPDRRIR